MGYTPDDLPKPEKVFTGKFNLNHFNQVFDEMNEEKQEIEAQEYQVSKFSLPGVDIQTSLAGTSISTFNGIMIVGDDYEQNGFQSQFINQKGDNFTYSDYKHSYNSHNNPNSLSFKNNNSDWIKKRKDQTESLSSSDFKLKLNQLQSQRSEPFTSQESESEYYQRRAKELKDESLKNAQFVSRFESQFPSALIQQSKQGLLESSDNRPDSWM